MSTNNVNSNFDSGYTYGGYNDQHQYGGYPQQQQQYGGYPAQPPQQPGYPYPAQQQLGYAVGSQQQFGNISSQGYVQQPPSSSGQFGDNKGVNPPSYSVSVEGVNTAGYSSESNKQDDPFEALNSFSDKAVRTAFIQKVYAILMCQLIVTGAIMSAIMFVPTIKDYVNDPDNMWLLWVSIGATFACVIALACCPGVRRKTPGNFICLFIFTIAEGFMLGMVASTYDVDAVLMAVGTTAGVTLVLTIFAFQTKWDFTGCGGVLLCMLTILLISGIFFAFIPTSRYAQIGYSAVGALIFSFYIIYDTQIMLGGKHKYSLSPEEYIFAALNLYLDIINLFMYLLAIFGGNRGSNN